MSHFFLKWSSEAIFAVVFVMIFEIIFAMKFAIIFVENISVIAGGGTPSCASTWQWTMQYTRFYWRKVQFFTVIIIDLSTQKCTLCCNTRYRLIIFAFIIVGFIFRENILHHSQILSQLQLIWLCASWLTKISLARWRRKKV